MTYTRVTWYGYANTKPGLHDNEFNKKKQQQKHTQHKRNILTISRIVQRLIN